MRRWWLLATGSVFAVACSLFTSLDGVSNGGSDTPDAQGETSASSGGDATPTDDAEPSDTGADTTLADTGMDAGPNLQPNGGFELFTGGTECSAEWGTFQSVGTRVSDAHSGMYACQICGNVANNYSIGDNDSPMLDVAPGDHLVVTAWVKAVAGDASGQDVRGSIRIYASASDNSVVQRIDPPLVSLPTTWMRIETVLDITKAGRFNYYIAFYNGPIGSCAIIDDVEVHKN